MQKLFVLGFTLLGVNLHAQKSSDPTDFNQFNFQKIVESNQNKTIANHNDYQSQKRLAIAYSQLENHSMSFILLLMVPMNRTKLKKRQMNRINIH